MFSSIEFIRLRISQITEKTISDWAVLNRFKLGIVILDKLDCISETIFHKKCHT
jgi:hypothetical protein